MYVICPGEGSARRFIDAQRRTEMGITQPEDKLSGPYCTRIGKEGGHGKEGSVWMERYQPFLPVDPKPWLLLSPSRERGRGGVV